MTAAETGSGGDWVAQPALEAPRDTRKSEQASWFNRRIARCAQYGYAVLLISGGPAEFAALAPREREWAAQSGRCAG